MTKYMHTKINLMPPSHNFKISFRIYLFIFYVYAVDLFYYKENIKNKLFREIHRPNGHGAVPGPPTSLPRKTFGSLERNERRDPSPGPACSDDGDAVYSSSKFKKSIGPLVMYAISDVDALPWRRERALCSYNDVIYTCRPLFLISPAYVTSASAASPRAPPGAPRRGEALFSIPFLNYRRKTSTLRNNSY